MSDRAALFSGKNWTETFTRVEQELAQALETVRQRQKALETYLQTATVGDSTAPNWPKSLEELFQRTQQLPALVERAGERVAEVDAVLAEGEKALQDWLAATGAAREKLASWVARAVG